MRQRNNKCYCCQQIPIQSFSTLFASHSCSAAACACHSQFGCSFSWRGKIKIQRTQLYCTINRNESLQIYKSKSLCWASFICVWIDAATAIITLFAPSTALCFLVGRYPVLFDSYAVVTKKHLRNCLGDDDGNRGLTISIGAGLNCQFTQHSLCRIVLFRYLPTTKWPSACEWFQKSLLADNSYTQLTLSFHDDSAGTFYNFIRLPMPFNRMAHAFIASHCLAIASNSQSICMYPTVGVLDRPEFVLHLFKFRSHFDLLWLEIHLELRAKNDIYTKFHCNALEAICVDQLSCGLPYFMDFSLNSLQLSITKIYSMTRNYLDWFSVGRMKFQSQHFWPGQTISIQNVYLNSDCLDSV